jgi:hypothetical protein
MNELAVILVTWNVRELALQAIRSLLRDVEQFGPTTAVYVIDCASTDGTADAIKQAFPHVQVTVSPENLGFARANNTVLRQIGFNHTSDDALPTAVYLLNPDTITQPGATRTLYNTLLSDPRNGLVGAQLAYGDGSFQHSAFAFPGLRQLWVELFPTPGRLIEGSFNGRYARARYMSGQPFLADCVLGATMMVRREVITQVGMFDEQFFMYCEEIDWARRIGHAGWRVLCVPSARVTHLGGQSTGQIRPQSVINLWDSRMRLFRKHYPPQKYWIARQMIMRGMQLKLRDQSLPQVLREAYSSIYERARTG